MPSWCSEWPGRALRNSAAACPMRAAQLSMAGEERWQAAYYWAPYVFLGEWR